MSKALMLVDIQKDYFPGGSMELVRTENAAQTAKSLLTAFRENDKTIVHIRHVNGVKEVVFCGMMSHMCIDATVRAAFDKGFTCVVAEDACATRNLSFGGIDVPSSHVHASFMAALSAVYATVTTSKRIIEEIAE